MSKLVCFKHPHYVGNDSPTLSCKACCSIFIMEIKRQNAAAQTDAVPSAPVATANSSFDTKKWLEERAKEARQALNKKPSVHTVNSDLV